MVSRHGYRSKKFPAATYVRACFINITKTPKKLKKCVIFGNRNWLEVQYYELPYDQGQYTEVPLIFEIFTIKVVGQTIYSSSTYKMSKL